MKTNQVMRGFSRLRRALFWLPWALLLAFVLASDAFASVRFLLTGRYEAIVGREDIAGLARELEHFGTYDLPCGGGLLTDSPKASRWLRLGYGRQGAASRCLRLLAEGPLDDEHETLIAGLACDVLYRLGDTSTVEELRKLRESMLSHQQSLDESAPAGADAQKRITYAERLIAGLCQRLGMEIPVGIPPLDKAQIEYWFY